MLEFTLPNGACCGSSGALGAALLGAVVGGGAAATGGGGAVAKWPQGTAGVNTGEGDAMTGYGGRMLWSGRCGEKAGRFCHLGWRTALLHGLSPALLESAEHQCKALFHQSIAHACEEALHPDAASKLSAPSGEGPPDKDVVCRIFGVFRFSSSRDTDFATLGGSASGRKRERHFAAEWEEQPDGKGSTVAVA